MCCSLIILFNNSGDRMNQYKEKCITKEQKTKSSSINSSPKTGLIDSHKKKLHSNTTQSESEISTETGKQIIVIEDSSFLSTSSIDEPDIVIQNVFSVES